MCACTKFNDIEMLTSCGEKSQNFKVSWNVVFRTACLTKSLLENNLSKSIYVFPLDI
ncbi:MAG: hypothetical protein C5S43_02710 [Candidatus Methanocomedens sp.]|nr:MAG: hypothetical protein C5S43_02710 [ANME-2 cluster archaeon]